MQPAARVARTQCVAGNMLTQRLTAPVAEPRGTSLHATDGRLKHDVTRCFIMSYAEQPMTVSKNLYAPGQFGTAGALQRVSQRAADARENDGRSSHTADLPASI